MWRMKSEKPGISTCKRFISTVLEKKKIKKDKACNWKEKNNSLGVK